MSDWNSKITRRKCFFFKNIYKSVNEKNTVRYDLISNYEDHTRRDNKICWDQTF